MTMAMTMTIQSTSPPFGSQCCRWVRSRTTMPPWNLPVTVLAGSLALTA